MKSSWIFVSVLMGNQWRSVEESVSECKLSKASRGFILSSYPAISLKQLLIILAFFFPAYMTVISSFCSTIGDPFLASCFSFEVFFNPWDSCYLVIF